MADTLLSVGIDVGTTTTQLIFSRLTVENRAGAFAAPDLDITERVILYESPIHFTPLLTPTQIDADALADLIGIEYRQAGIQRNQVSTGAVIITGETARKENARAVVKRLSSFAGDFVVATAGPDLESELAARGAGVPVDSAATGQTILHMDIGGGTSNLALVRAGIISDTGCLNVGGRLVTFDQNRRIQTVSPVLQGLWDLPPGTEVTPERLTPLLELLVQALEEAAGLRPETQLLSRLTTNRTVALPEEPVTLSFSGGVAALMGRDEADPFRYGDLGVLLARAIRRSRLCAGSFRLGRETIRATVIGAGCHSTRLSGSTVFYTGVEFPLRDLPVTALTPEDQALPGEALSAQIRQRLRRYCTREDRRPVALALPGLRSPKFSSLCALADALADGFMPLLEAGLPAVAVSEADCAKALGQALAYRLPPETPVLCLDRLRLSDGSFLDVGVPVGNGAAVPVLIKTLILPKNGGGKIEAENQTPGKGL